MSRTTDLTSLWRAIERAGGIDSYVNGQLSERGFLVERREIDTLSDREREAYKKQLKEEAARRLELRREAWQAYKARHIVHLGEGIFWDDHATEDKWDAPDAEERAAENELPPLDGPRDLAEALGLTIPQLRWLAFHRDAATSIHYARFTVAKRDGSERAIWAPMPTLKAAQRWILRNISEKLPIHGASHGFLPGRSIKSNAQEHVGSKLVLKMDLADFFPSVTYPRVRGIFRRAGYREQVSTLLALICTEAPREVVEEGGTTYYVALGPRCLPQGAPTSPSLTNTLCLRLDRRLSGLARSLGWRYTRYADDLTFSLPASHGGEPRLGALLGGARRVVESEGFAVRLDKTRVARAGARQQVTGLVVNGEGPARVPRRLRRQLRAAAHNLEVGRAGPDADPVDRLAGLASFVCMTDPALGAALLGRLRGGSAG
ncbi:reverse transcriptase family protein [Tautonia plasticadhaerens]|uniref:RNA-directed DNA polymerase n=1 Tax=Tautonia plasticadhaerens TaxID=2527974 RepID=A0A518H1R4_9BACT|nr:reverse transcriptase family protein [Tautonia plasticadhaerens]QDV34783.1 Reverse transcriptase (RNA-dependent DNA polymerase) [Tautonia plasticadhaerens]